MGGLPLEAGLMILSGQEILRQIGKGIVIEPFDERRLNLNLSLPISNSIKLSLSSRLSMPLTIYQSLISSKFSGAGRAGCG